MTEGQRLAVFLDRDGVLNRCVVRGGKPYPPASLHELEILPGVPEALARLRQAGFVLIVVTNQPDVARGTQRREVVEAINAALGDSLPLDQILTCYDDGDMPRRKPNPGMLLEAAEKNDLTLRELSDRRPLEGCRSGQTCRLPNCSTGLRLSGGKASRNRRRLCGCGHRVRCELDPGGADREGAEPRD